MALAGSLSDFGLPDIFQLIEQQQKDGLLKIEQKDGGVTLVFSGGMIVDAWRTGQSSEKTIANALIRRYLIQPEDLGRIGEWQRTESLDFPLALINHKVVDRDTIVKVWRIELQELIYDLFCWETGKYEFNTDVEVQTNRYVSAFRPQGLLMEGYRWMDELPAAERGSTPGSILEPTDKLDPDKLEEAEQIIARIANGQLTVKDICDYAILPRLDAMQAIKSLVTRKILVVTGELADHDDEISDFTVLGEDGPIRRFVPPVFLVFTIVVAGYLFGMRAVESAERIINGTSNTYVLEADKRRAAGLIQQALDVYRTDRGRYPTSLDELVETGVITPELLEFPFGAGYTLDTDTVPPRVLGAPRPGQSE